MGAAIFNIFKEKNLEKKILRVKSLRRFFIGVILCLLCWIVVGKAFLSARFIESEFFNDSTAFQSVVLIDSELFKSIPEEELGGSRVVKINGNRDVVDQITEALQGLHEINDLRVISHGSDGKLWFGNQVFDVTTLSANFPKVASWSKSLSADAQILLNGARE